MYLTELKVILLVIVFVSAQTNDPFKLQIGSDFELYVIEDLLGQSKLSEIFTKGAFGPPVQPDLLIPELTRLGYTLGSPPTSFYVPINCLYGVYRNDIHFIIDTGLGPFISSNKSMFMDTLVNMIGVDPTQIDYVILTHAHPDHSGGLVTPSGEPLFPNAHLVIGLEEWELWLSKNPDWADFCCPQLLDDMLPYVQTALKFYDSKKIFVNGVNDTSFDAIPGLTLLNSFAHTSYNDIFVTIESDGEVFHMVGDLYFTPYHLEDTTIGCTHDHHIVDAITDRRRFAPTFKPKDLILGMHFAFPGLGYFDGQSFVPLNNTKSQIQ